MQLDKGRDQSAARRAYTDLSRVTLEHAIASEDGLLPAGASGTVVHAYPAALAYEVEFTTPFHTVAIVGVDDIVAGSDRITCNVSNPALYHFGMTCYESPEGL